MSFINNALRCCVWIVAALFVFSSSAFAANSVNVHGVVASSCTVSVTDLNVDLDILHGEANREIADVTETCNTTNGYTVSVSSSHNGVMASEGAGHPTVDYSIKYGGRSSGLDSPLTLNRGASTKHKSVVIKATVPASPGQLAGYYSDTLTVTVAAK